MSSDINYDQHYRTLRLSPGASLDEIKRRYRELALRYHPDKVTPTERERATHLFQQINQAKEQLEAYWEQHHNAPPHVLQQRFEDALQQQQTLRAQQFEEIVRRARERQQRQREKHTHSYRQRTATVSDSSRLSLWDRLFIILASEAAILVVLWLGYHALSSMHVYLTVLATPTPSLFASKVILLVIFLALLACGYLTGICLIILFFLILFVPYETLVDMLTGRRKRSTHHFPRMASEFHPRRRGM
ncbi:MAG: J domain-containing protein [Candidatus Binatia bacterium]